MSCFICGNDIGSNQLRHSDGTGDYHMLCEFNAQRRLQGLPPIESVKRVKYYSPLDEVPVMSHKNWKPKKESYNDL